MLALLTKLLGLPATDAGKIVGVALSYHGVRFGLVVLLALLMTGMSFALYYRIGGEFSRWRKWLLASLRTVFLLLLLALLLRPALALTLEAHVRQSLLLLFDASGSMNIKEGKETQSVK